MSIRTGVHVAPITSLLPINYRKKKITYIHTDKPLYAIYDEQSPSFDLWGRPGTGDVLGITNVHFTSDKQKLLSWAEDYRKEKLGEHKRYLKDFSDVPGSIVIPAPQHGRDASYVLTDHDVDEAMNWYERALATAANGELDYDEVPDDFAKVPIDNPDEEEIIQPSKWGHPVRGRRVKLDDLSYRQIVHSLNLDRVEEVMKPRVVRLQDLREDTLAEYDSLTGSDEPLVHDIYKVDMKWRSEQIGNQSFLTVVLEPRPPDKQLDVED
jgi:hypothetical protein